MSMETEKNLWFVYSLDRKKCGSGSALSGKARELKEKGENMPFFLTFLPGQHRMGLLMIL